MSNVTKNTASPYVNKRNNSVGISATPIEGSKFIDDCERMLELFKSVHGRQPVNGTEFAEWCEYYERNQQTTPKQIINLLKQ